MQRPRGHALVFVAGLVLLATSFVPLWATYRVPGLDILAPHTVHQNAWSAYGVTMQLGLALALAATVGAAVVLVRADLRSPNAAVAVLVGCCAATLLLAWQVVAGPVGISGSHRYGVDRGILLFTGTALAGAMTYGSYVAWKETGRGGAVRG